MGMYKAKNIAKKIVTCSLVFALTATSMPIGLKASAATAPVLNKTAKTLYINSNEIGSSYDFNIKNKVSKSTYKWTTSNKSIATVDAEGLAKAGSETGKVTISCKITLPTKKTKTLKAIVTVKENADRVEITNPIETELGIGANVYDFDSAMTTASGAKATDYRMWEISSEGNTAGATVISSDGRVTTAHAGEFKIRVRAFQNNEKLAANKTVNSDWLTVKVVASAKSVSQTDSSKVVVTFDDDMKDKLQTSDFTITSKDGSRVMSITGLTYSEDGKAVTLEATSMFANNGEYILTYKGNQFNFSTLVKEEVSSYVPTSPSPNPPPTEQESGIRESLTALEVTKLMGNGINLGNTMEAYGKMYLGITAEVSAYETLWGMPVTTQEMISAMKAAGFDTLRIPVAWTNVMDYENGNYTIREDYLNRVEEIIKYAFNEDMYVIVNDHWDGGWWGMFGSATQSTRDAAMELYTSMWTQIANRYKEYSDYLIFESGNEELGSRLNDTDAPLTADSGTLSVDECYEMANQINQKFVEIIRSTGGNNAKRFLLIAGYNTDITRTCDDRFVMPTDTASNKLLISVHYYNPDGYTFNSSLSSWGTKSDFETQNMYMKKMTKFTEQGYGVIIGEYCVGPVDGKVKNNTVDYTDNLLNNSDIYGFCPVLWDCSNMFDRGNLKIIDDGVAALYIEHSYAVQSTMSEEDVIAIATEKMETALAGAAEDTGVDENTAKAWIMYNSSDWSTMYSSGDTYNPSSKTDGILATDVEITGEGSYTVSLDFTGTRRGSANSVVFSALGIANGETLFPNYVATITEIKINGQTYTMQGKSYTSSDDGKCTRVNLYNEWVPVANGRTADGDLTGATPRLLDKDTLGDVETISITFNYAPAGK